MTIIGLAGASGSGKSTIAARLAQRLDGVHIDADRVGHELLETDGDVIEGIRRRFGEAVFDARGRVDRRALGAAIFTDASARADLNAVIHPAIARACARRVEQARRQGAAVAVVDAALLLEVDMPFQFDLVVALRCGEEERFARIMARGGWSEEEVRRRLESQRDLEKSFYKADVVVDTDGELEDVLAEVGREVDRVVDAAGGR